MKTKTPGPTLRKFALEFLRRLFWNNVSLKGLSVLLAFLLWFQLASQQTVQRTISLPVEFVNMPSQLEISNDYPRQVDAVIRSSRGTTKIDERQLAVLVDLNDSVAGTEVVPITERHIRNLPYGTELVSITPARVRLVLETTARKIVKVDPVVSGSPAPAYQVVGFRVVPKEVVIRGPESRLSKLTAASTQPINISGLDASLTVSVYVDLDDPSLRVEDTNSVKVTVQIEEQRRPVKLLRVPVRMNPPDAAIQPMTKTVEVHGSVPLSFAGQLKAEDFVAVVEVGDLMPDRKSYELTPRIRPPPEWTELFRLESVVPPEVRAVKTR